MSVYDKLVGAVERVDGWVNAFTGLGTARDKITHGRFGSSIRIPDEVLSDLFADNDLAKTLVTKRNGEMLRKGYRITSDSESLPDTLRGLSTDLGFDARLLEGLNLGKLYGGSLLLYGIDGDPSEPVDRVHEINYVNVVDRRNAQPKAIFDDPLTPEFGTVGQYSLPGGGVIHADRVQRFGGQYTEPERRRNLQGWDVSILQEAHTVLSQFGQSWQAVANMMVSAAEGVFAIKNLMSLIGEDSSKGLETRMAMVSLQRSVARDILIDAEFESYTRQQISFQGIAQVLDIMMMRLSALADIPVTKLFGRAPAGMNASGDADIRLFYDSVETEQTNKLKPILLRFYGMLAQSENIVEPFGIKFNSLWSADPKTEAETGKLVAEMDATYHEIGALDALEIRSSRFAGTEGRDIVLDPELTEELAKQSTDEPTDEPTDETSDEPTDETTDEPVGTVALTATTPGEVLTLNETRASLPVPHKAWGDDPGQQSGDGHLAVFAFKAKQSALIDAEFGTTEPESKIDAVALHDLDIDQARSVVVPARLEGEVSDAIIDWVKLPDDTKSKMNPPAWATDESCWEKAKGVAEKTDPSDFWAFVAWLYLFHFNCG